MDKEILRRRFLISSVLVAGGALVGARFATAGYGGGRRIEEPGPISEVMSVKDPENLTLHEKKHVPVIEMPEKVYAGKPFPLNVTVGEVIHPMVADHYIQYVELFVDGLPAGNIDLKPLINFPKVTFNLVLNRSGTLVAREFCNLHGLWESRREITLS